MLSGPTAKRKVQSMFSGAPKRCSPPKTLTSPSPLCGSLSPHIVLSVPGEGAGAQEELGVGRTLSERARTSWLAQVLGTSGTCETGSGCHVWFDTSPLFIPGSLPTGSFTLVMVHLTC